MLKQVQRQATIHLNANSAQVYPLFTPKGEERWVPGWKPTYIYPESGDVCLNSVFTTEKDGVETLWVTVLYNPRDYQTAFINIVPDVVVRRVDVQCEVMPNNRTAVTCNIPIPHLV